MSAFSLNAYEEAGRRRSAGLFDMAKIKDPDGNPILRRGFLDALPPAATG